MPTLNNLPLNLLLICILLGSLLLAGCGQMSLDIDLGQDENGDGLANTNLFWLMIAVLFVLFAVALVGARG